MSVEVHWVQIKDTAESPKDIRRIAPQPLLAARVVTILKSKPQMIFWDFLVVLWIEVQNIYLTREKFVIVWESYRGDISFHSEMLCLWHEDLNLLKSNQVVETS